MLPHSAVLDQSLLSMLLRGRCDFVGVDVCAVVLQRETALQPIKMNT